MLFWLGKLSLAAFLFSNEEIEVQRQEGTVSTTHSESAETWRPNLGITCLLVNGRATVLRSSSVSISEQISVIEDLNQTDPSKTWSLSHSRKYLFPAQESKLGEDFSWQVREEDFVKLPISWPSVRYHSRKCIFTPLFIRLYLVFVQISIPGPLILFWRKAKKVQLKTKQLHQHRKNLPILICQSRKIHLFLKFQNIWAICIVDLNNLLMNLHPKYLKVMRFLQ